MASNAPYTHVHSHVFCLLLTLNRMMDIEGAWDLLKGVPVTLWMLSSVIILGALSPASAVHEFTAHRMQQFDLYGTQYGEGIILLS